MRQVVARARPRRAAFFFQRTVAGEIELPFSRIRRQQLLQKLCGALRIIAQNFPQTFGFRRFRLVEPRDAVFARPIRDVFVIRGAGLLLPEQEFALFRGNGERRAREI